VKQPPAVPPRWGEDAYKKEQKEIADFLKKGREYYLTGEYGASRVELESVMKRDPHNTEAIRLLEKMGQKKYDVSTMELEATRKNMMGDLRETWNPRDYAIDETPTVIQTGGRVIGEDEDKVKRMAIIAKMKRIVIPEIDFRLANIHDVIDFLHDMSVEFDTSTDPEERKGVNIILNLQQAGGSGGAAAEPADDLMDFGFEDDMGDEAAAAAGPLSASEVPPITFKTRYVSLMEALRIVTDIAGLKWRVEGSVVMVVPLNAADGRIIHTMYDVQPSLPEKFADISASLEAGRGERDGFIEMTANDMGYEDNWKQLFKDMGVQWPDGSSIRHVPAIGKLMVANTAENLTVFEKILSEINVVPNQIEIETRFVEIAQFDSNSLGFEWLLSDDWEMFQRKGEDGLPLSGKQRIIMGANNEGAAGLPAGGFTRGLRFLEADMTEAEVTDDILSIASVLTNPELQFVLHMLEQTGHADLLSAPKVTTQAGEEATIKVVTEYIYPTEFEVTPIVIAFEGAAIPVGGVVEPGSFETREVGVILSVLPDVSPEGSMINLVMTPEVVSEPIWKDYGVSFTDPDGNTISLPMEQPFFHTRMVSTSVSIYNGATIAMGGMINEWREDADDKVPFFGNIPFIGRLFQSKYEKSEKRNLLIFVTARLVDPNGRAVGKGMSIPSTISSTSAE
jgi:general secretion pathway protein D